LHWVNEVVRKLGLPAECLDLIIRHVQQEAPYEACGLLGGVGEQVALVFCIPNVAPNLSTGFLMEPQAQLSALLAIEEHGMELVAIYHSHPPGARGDPSPSDVAQAYYPGVAHLIIVPDADGKIANLRAFLIEGGQVSEVPVIIT
jgi:proteasome lid subunit RPN8/RPN11